MKTVNAVKSQNTKFVAVSTETHQRLGDFGKKSESYGRIVSRLLDTVELYQTKYGEINLNNDNYNEN